MAEVAAEFEEVAAAVVVVEEEEEQLKLVVAELKHWPKQPKKKVVTEEGVASEPELEIPPKPLHSLLKKLVLQLTHHFPCPDCSAR